MHEQKCKSTITGFVLTTNSTTTNSTSKSTGSSKTTVATTIGTDVDVTTVDVKSVPQPGGPEVAIAVVDHGCAKEMTLLAVLLPVSLFFSQ